MKFQIGFFLSMLFVSMLLIFLVLYLIYQDTLQPASLNGIATLQLQGVEYQSSNGFLGSNIYFDGVYVPVIDILNGYNINNNANSYIYDQLYNDTINYFQDSSTLLAFDLNNNTLGVCYNMDYVNYNIYINGQTYNLEVCPPTLLAGYYYNISCVQ
ncbi:hypothetical protein MJ1_0049 [Nanobdella aerobiophila]|uniref:Uncharacterized protein n=1 Tax=Nanobdella aerobiophila TaxID=2586965 RepID=A0A915WR70_9ARCH|nr:hypothetical protein [Nanobdella aerobiophila]BBL45228.1 hypothetical protein MJ1_0049 [Nanobdella aerobiophila]